MIKVRRPGLLEAVERDLAIAVAFARIAQRRTAWGRSFEVGAVAEYFASSLRNELDLREEGRHAAEVATALEARPGVQAPRIVEELTTERLLVIDRLVGEPLSALGPDRLPAEQARSLADQLCASQVEAMLQGERFHGDPHPGNVLLMEDGTLEHLSPGYPLIEQVAALGGAELRDRTTPSSVGEMLQSEWAQLGPLVRRAPRHLDRIATLLQHGGLTTRVRLFSERGDVAVAERLLNRAVLAGLSLGVLLIAVLMLMADAGPALAGTEIRLLEVLGWIGLFAGVVLLLRVLLEVLRPAPTDRGSP